MLASLALLFLLSISIGWVLQKWKLPTLLGMLLIGIALGPYAGNVIDTSVLHIAPQIRQIALLIILIRAGLSLSLQDIKQIGRPAILLAFIPATLEIIGTILLAPTIVSISILEAAILGTVLAAVSPAIIVPRMPTLIEKNMDILIKYRNSLW